MLLDPTPAEAVVDPRDAAESAGLRYVSDEEPGIRRRKAGKGFAYLKPDGTQVEDAATLDRIRSLAIPPAYTDVWICPQPNGHIQATGRDAKGRKQYRYHPAFREVRESTKYEHMLEFAQALPAIRTKIDEHMALRGLPREKVLATVVHLLETTLIRVGNEDYAKQNKSYGLTTLRDPHVKVEGAELRFQFKGKSGKTWRLQVKDRRVARIVKACQDLPGQDLFQYLDEDGERQIRHLGGRQRLSQGDHRLATSPPRISGPGPARCWPRWRSRSSRPSTARPRRRRTSARRSSASRPGSATRRRSAASATSIRRSSPPISKGQLLLEIREEVESELRDNLSGLKPEEAAVLTLLAARLNRDAKADPGARTSTADAPPQARRRAEPREARA